MLEKSTFILDLEENSDHECKSVKNLTIVVNVSLFSEIIQLESWADDCIFDYKLNVFFGVANLIDF